MFLRTVILAALAISLSACNEDGSDRLAEKARIEGQGANAAQLEALKKRSIEMEEDLAGRQRFYQSVRGTYEGDLRTDVGSFKVRLILVPSVPPYRAGRIRTLEEITAELTALSFSAQVIQWNPEVPLSAVGCRVDSIHPDLNTGEINIASRDCPNLYTIRLSDAADKLDKIPSNNDVSSRIAEQVREGKLESVSAITGRMYPTTSASVYSFHASRVQR